MSSERVSTIGQQRQFNYALKPMSKDEFVKMMLADLPEVPVYFPTAARKNKEGARALSDLHQPRAFSPSEVVDLMRSGHVVVDVRSNTLFGAGHLPGSINIGLGGQFASWAGSLLAMETPLILVAEDKDAIEEAVMRLARAGHESVVGYLDGGIYAWTKAGQETGETPQIGVAELKDKIESDSTLQVIDVRRRGEYDGGHVPGAKNIPLAELKDNLDKVERDRPTAVICAGGYRSSIATCILKEGGVAYLYNTIGGTGAWRSAGYDLEMEDKARSCAPA
jgi:rhodanese-related sulfurtransferase